MGSVFSHYQRIGNEFNANLDEISTHKSPVEIKLSIPILLRSKRRELIVLPEAVEHLRAWEEKAKSCCLAMHGSSSDMGAPD